jgi:hypothetical protein
MRIFTLAAILTVAAGTMLASAPARAQGWSSRYPVCLQIYGPDQYRECRYTSIEQCQAAASGRPGDCEANPFIANTEDADAPPPPAPPRRPRRA